MFVLAVNNGTLSASRAFTTLSLIEIVTTPLTLLLQALPSITTSLACLDRIQDYLKSPEKLDPRAADQIHTVSTAGSTSNTSLNPTRLDYNDDAAVPLEKLQIVVTNAPLPSVAVSFKDATISYETSGPGSHVLESICWTVPHGSTTLVLGPPASGKSSLLKAILGEIHVEGELYVRSGSIAYCGQDPWIPNESVEDCIIGMSDLAFDKAWYDEVVYACALGEDGDLCAGIKEGSDAKVVGSRGITLSEGQKQRLVCSPGALFVQLFPMCDVQDWLIM